MIMTKEEAEHCVEVVLRCLMNRKGFDDWWGNIDEEIEREIREELAKDVQNSHEP